MLSDNLCPFCDVNERYRFIAESSLVRAIYPKSPACKFHVLLVPKRHVKTVDEMTTDETGEIFLMISKITTIARQKLDGFEGYNILSNNGGPSVNQRVPHAHIHVFLRTKFEKDNPITKPHTSVVDLTDAQRAYLALLQSWF